MLHIVYLVVAADPSSCFSNFVTIAQLHVFQMVNVYFSTPFRQVSLSSTLKAVNKKYTFKNFKEILR